EVKPSNRSVFCSARVSSAFRISNGPPSKHPLGDASDDEAGICFDGVKFIPPVGDHEEDLNGECRGNLKRHRAGAIRIQGICARSGHLAYVAVLACHCSEGSTAFPVKDLRTDLDKRP